MAFEDDLLGLNWENTLFDLTELTADIIAEAKRSVVKHGFARTAASSMLTDAEKFIILSEEIGEVATAMTYDRGSLEELEKELIQVATISSLWVTQIKNRLGK